MALTAQDVHDKQFKLVRQSTGYDIDEVDSFLDEVESEFARLTAELDAARAAVASAERAAAEATERADAEARAAAEARDRAEAASRTAAEATERAERMAREAADPATESADSAHEHATLGDGADSVFASAQVSTASFSEPDQSPAATASTEAAPAPSAEAATRILALAQQTADSYVAEARQQADALVAGAEERGRSMLEALESQRAELDTKRGDLEVRVSALRAYESEIRTRLTSYFEGQLQELRAAFPEPDGTTREESGEG